MRYHVDLPDPLRIGTKQCEKWTNIDTFDSKEEAIEFIREHIDSTVDENGKICLLAESE